MSNKKVLVGFDNLCNRGKNYDAIERKNYDVIERGANCKLRTWFSQHFLGLKLFHQQRTTAIILEL